MAPGASEREVALSRAKDPAKRKEILTALQRINNAGILVAAQWAPSTMQTLVTDLKDAWDRPGTASFGHLSVSLGDTCGATCHLDPGDVDLALWVVLGGPVEIFFPEAGMYVQLFDGDVMSFEASKVWHCCMGVQNDMLPSHPPYIVSSLYSNRNRTAETKKRKHEQINSE